MKSLFHPARALLAAALLALAASPVVAADAKTEALKNAQDQLEILKNKYADEHPQVVEQKLRITQLQRRIDEERQDRLANQERVNAEVRRRRELRTAQSQGSSDEQTNSPSRSQIIRTEIRLLTPKAGGDFDVLAAPTLITQSGQDSSLSFGAFHILLNSSVDEQNNITTSLELTSNNPDGKPAEKTKLPRVTNRPGARSTVSVKDGPTVEILATLVDPKGISIDFPGGSLAQLLAAISKSGSEPFNLIASQDALALAVPAFSVRSAGPRDLALALDQLLVGYIVDFPTEKAPRDGLPIFTIRSNRESAPTQPPPQPERFASYPLGAVLQNKIQVNDVIETINAAWLLDPSHRPEGLKLKYHATTGILLVSSRDQTGLDIAHNVIANLGQQAEYLRTNPPAQKP